MIWRKQHVQKAMPYIKSHKETQRATKRHGEMQFDSVQAFVKALCVALQPSVLHCCCTLETRISKNHSLSIEKLYSVYRAAKWERWDLKDKCLEQTHLYQQWANGLHWNSINEDSKVKKRQGIEKEKLICNSEIQYQIHNSLKNLQNIHKLWKTISVICGKKLLDLKAECLLKLL